MGFLGPKLTPAETNPLVVIPTRETPKIYSAFQWAGLGALIQSVIRADT